MRHCPTSAAGRQRGTSLLEALAAVAIAAIGIAALVSAFETALGQGQLLRERSLGTAAMGRLLESRRGLPGPALAPAPPGGAVRLCQRGDAALRVWLVWPPKPGMAAPECGEAMPRDALELSQAAP